MGALELAAARYSVRSYSDRPIATEKMEKLSKAGQLAPTAVNFQPQKIYVLKSKEAIQKIHSLTQFAYNAPVVLLVCADKRVDLFQSHSRFVERSVLSLRWTQTHSCQ